MNSNLKFMKHRFFIALGAVIIAAVSLSPCAESKGLKGLLKKAGDAIVSSGKEIGKGVINDLKTTGEGIVNDVLSGSSESNTGQPQGSQYESGAQAPPVYSPNSSSTRKTSSSTASRTTGRSKKGTSAGAVRRSKDEPTEAGRIGDLSFKNLTLKNPMFRLGENGLILDQQGMSLEGTIPLTVNGQRGKRIVCLVEPIIEGSYMQDGIGECTAVYAFTATSDQFSGDLTIAIPYQWLGIDIYSKVNEPKDIELSVTLADWASQTRLAQTVFDIDGSNMKLEGNVNPYAMLGELFEGSPQGNVISTCSACDGTGLCNSCYGDGYLDPSACRKCAADPGVCRRCHGTGEEGATVRESGGLFDLMF